MNEIGIKLTRLSDNEQLEVEFKSGSILVGRNTEVCTLVLEDKHVARIHARFDFENGSLFLYDINSKNGTYFNGAKLEEGTPAIVNVGDTITFAGVDNYTFDGYLEGCPQPAETEENNAEVNETPDLYDNQLPAEEQAAQYNPENEMNAAPQFEEPFADPNQAPAFDPNQYAQPYIDPNQAPAFDPNQYAQPYIDPNQAPAFDPNQYAQPYIDPNQAPAFDLNQYAQPYADPNQAPAFDPNQYAQPYADPNQAPAYDPNQYAQPYADPNQAPAYDPNQYAQPYADPNQAPAFDQQFGNADQVPPFDPNYYTNNGNK